ncbi:RNA polymerase sigma-70 factor (ECF subfamily) [Terracoccus luteus]|uniref:RNA polymerase sigma-70 factor (ECF subfamily) n=1 Tax=Terracoccus luteus TaxID=53356 RepID=A0A495XRN2_9MICO|nr:DUF6596 domain-containing protein [Terracoccus luteus]RKT76757.1 RNA polymerase sigma-70 factor (ECF subfamily) [Terracoccus luteus]
MAIVASLIRLTGDWDLAEDCVHDAAERALTTWPRDGVPGNPAAWLTTAARRRALDVLRRRGREASALREVVATEAVGVGVGGDAGGGYFDDRLRLLFACCHPSLSLQDRVALTLKTVCGLSTRDIARLFVVGEATMGQRLLRTRRQAAREALAFAVPPADQVDDRVDGVLAVIYLVFTEGYAVGGEGLRDELADEALVLAQLATWLLPQHAEAHALRALVLLQHARRPARVDADGELVPLDEQDRTLWDRSLIAAGVESLRQARGLVVDGVVGPYRVQAEIAALHSTAPSFDMVDWDAVVGWYDGLLEATGSPSVELNHVVAIAMRDGADAGLVALDASSDACRAMPDAAAVRAGLLRRAGLIADTSAP